MKYLHTGYPLSDLGSIDLAAGRTATLDFVGNGLIEFAIGEGGGFNVRVAGTNFFTVQVAEKGVCWVRARDGRARSRLDASRGLGGPSAQRGDCALG